MNDNDPMDFSSLDPSRDGVRWERLIDTVADRGLAAHRGSPTVLHQIVMWSRPALAAAALVAIAIWLGALASIRTLDTQAKPVEDNDSVFVQWALGERGESVWEDLARVGGENGEL